MANKVINVGMVGAGIIAPMHAAGFQEVPERCRVTAVCDVDAEKASEIAGLFDARVYTDYHELIADPQVDLVDLLLPHHLHYPAAMAVLEAGKHLLLEKPVAVSYQQSLEICHKA